MPRTKQTLWLASRVAKCRMKVCKAQYEPAHTLCKLVQDRAKMLLVPRMGRIYDRREAHVLNKIGWCSAEV